MRNGHADKCCNENSTSRFYFKEERIMQVLRFFPTGLFEVSSLLGCDSALLDDGVIQYAQLFLIY
jgi:hypothetical protein